MLTSVDDKFDISEYSNLREIDYYHSVAEFLEYVDKDTFPHDLKQIWKSSLKYLLLSPFIQLLISHPKMYH